MSAWIRIGTQITYRVMTEGGAVLDTTDLAEAAAAVAELEGAAAAGREKWHLRDCRDHHNMPGGCGQA